MLRNLNRLQKQPDGPSHEAFLSVNDIDCNRVEQYSRIAHTDICFVIPLSGVLVHHDDPACQLNSFLFVDPKWLFHLLAHLATRKDSKNTDGILKLGDLEKLLQEGGGEVKLPAELIPQMIR